MHYVDYRKVVYHDYVSQYHNTCHLTKKWFNDQYNITGGLITEFYFTMAMLYNGKQIFVCQIYIFSLN